VFDFGLQVLHVFIIHGFFSHVNQVLAGDVEPAIRTHKAFFAVWKRYGFTPEGFNLATSSVQVRENIS
jgi:hypothetical protein